MAEKFVEIPWHDGSKRVVLEGTPLRAKVGCGVGLAYAHEGGYTYWENEDWLINDWEDGEHAIEALEMAPEPRYAPEPKLEDGVYEFSHATSRGNRVVYYYAVKDGKVHNTNDTPWNKITNDDLLEHERWTRRRVGDSQ